MTSFSILIAEDNPVWQDIISRAIRSALKENTDINVSIVGAYDRANDALEQHWHLFISDLGFGSPHRSEKLMGKYLVEKAAHMNIPTIVVSGTPSTPQIARDMIKEYHALDFFWKQDFLSKDFAVKVREALGLHPSNIDKQPAALEKTIHIFLASSSELGDHRDAFDLYLRQENDQLRKRGIYLQVHRWENFLDAMSTTRLQDEYNQAVKECDIFVSLFKTKIGKYTEEEFKVAYNTFKEKGKPIIYTYFLDTQVSLASIKKADINSLHSFLEKLHELGHYPTTYENIHGLNLHFRGQIDKLIEQQKL
jgi:CheY-like chemotaxis protein